MYLEKLRVRGRLAGFEEAITLAVSIYCVCLRGYKCDKPWCETKAKPRRGQSCIDSLWLDIFAGSSVDVMVQYEDLPRGMLGLVEMLWVVVVVVGWCQISRNASAKLSSLV